MAKKPGLIRRALQRLGVEGQTMTSTSPAAASPALLQAYAEWLAVLVKGKSDIEIAALYAPPRPDESWEILSVEALMARTKKMPLNVSIPLDREGHVGLIKAEQYLRDKGVLNTYSGYRYVAAQWIGSENLQPGANMADARLMVAGFDSEDRAIMHCVPAHKICLALSKSILDAVRKIEPSAADNLQKVWDAYTLKNTQPVKREKLAQYIAGHMGAGNRVTLGKRTGKVHPKDCLELTCDGIIPPLYGAPARVFLVPKGVTARYKGVGHNKIIDLNRDYDVKNHISLDIDTNTRRLIVAHNPLRTAIARLEEDIGRGLWGDQQKGILRTLAKNADALYGLRSGGMVLLRELEQAFPYTRPIIAAPPCLEAVEAAAKTMTLPEDSSDPRCEDCVSFCKILHEISRQATDAESRAFCDWLSDRVSRWVYSTQQSALSSDMMRLIARQWGFEDEFGDSYSSVTSSYDEMFPTVAAKIALIKGQAAFQESPYDCETKLRYMDKNLQKGWIEDAMKAYNLLFSGVSMGALHQSQMEKGLKDIWHNYCHPVTTELERLKTDLREGGPYTVDRFMGRIRQEAPHMVAAACIQQKLREAHTKDSGK